MTEDISQSLSEQVTPLAPNSTLGMITHKLHYIHNGQYYTTGGFTNYVEGLAAHFKQTILMVPVEKTNDIAGLAKVQCKGYKIYPLTKCSSELKAGLFYCYIRRQARQALADCDIVNMRMYSMHSLIALPTIEKMKKPIFFSLTGQSGTDLEVMARWKALVKPIIVSWMESALRRHLTFVHGEHLVSLHNLNPDICLPTYSSTYHTNQIITSPITPPQPNELIRLIFVARLEYWKAADLLIQALGSDAELSKKFTLDIVGEGLERQRWEALSQRLGLKDTVTFHGYLSHGKDLDNMMASAHAMSYVPQPGHEGAPKVITEAFRFGLPVLASRVAAIPTVIQENINGWLVEPNNVQQIVDALKVIATIDRQKWETMSRANLELAESFAIEKVSYEMVKSLIDRNLLTVK